MSCLGSVRRRTWNLCGSSLWHKSTKLIEALYQKYPEWEKFFHTVPTIKNGKILEKNGKVYLPH